LILHKTGRSDLEKPLKTRKDPWHDPIWPDAAMGLYNLQYKQPSTMQEPPQKRSRAMPVPKAAG